MNAVKNYHLLPKALQRRPDIRGLTLQVFPGDDQRHFRVPGTDTIHDVFVTDTSIYCDCIAAKSGRQCAHYYAVKNHLQNKEQQHG